MRQRSGRTKERAENVVRDTRILHLAFLAPDIVEAILDGHQPPEVNVKLLTKDIAIPLSWERQRRVLGFS